MKPLKRKNYGSIPHLSNSKLGENDYKIHIGQERILTEKVRDDKDTVIVLEKYDGSNVGVCKVNGKIHPITRSGYLATTSPYKQHHYFAKWVKEREVLFYNTLKEGERLCGEWLVQAHGIKYNIDKRPPVVFFDWYDADSKRKPYFDLTIVYWLPFARVLHYGKSIPTSNLIDKLNEGTVGIEAENNKPEGMVYRLERDGKVEFMAKWVRPDFEAGKYMFVQDNIDLKNVQVNEKDLTWNVNIQDYEF